MFIVPLARTHRDPRLLSRLLDDSIDRFFATPAATPRPTSRSPVLDVVETAGAYTVTLEMPGVAKEDVKITVTGRRVTVQAEPSKPNSAESIPHVIHRERAAISYARSFTLPADLEQAESQARLEQGVLTLTLPKRVARNEAHITVN